MGSRRGHETGVYWVPSSKPVPGPEQVSKLVSHLFPSSLPLNAFLHGGRGLDRKASWALGHCGQAGCRSTLEVAFWGSRLREWVWQGVEGALPNDSLALSRQAGEPEQVWEESGRVLRMHEPYLERRAHSGHALPWTDRVPLDCIPSPNVVFPLGM